MTGAFTRRYFAAAREESSGLQDGSRSLEWRGAGGRTSSPVRRATRFPAGDWGWAHTPHFTSRARPLRTMSTMSHVDMMEDEPDEWVAADGGVFRRVRDAAGDG